MPKKIKQGKIISIESKDGWIKKEKQVLEKGLNLIVKKVEGDIVECWVVDGQHQENK